MSVINNVLKELATRPSQFTPINIASVNSQPVDKPESSNLSGSILLFLLTLAAIGLWYYQFQYKTQAVINVETPILASVVTEAIKAEAEIVELKPNQIVGLQISETSSDISLLFAMRERAVSYLKERSEDSFVYHIKNINSEIETPRISGNRWIEKLSITPSQQGVDVTLQTVAGVLVNTEQFQKQGETIWTIKLEKLPDPVVVAKLETVAAEPVIEAGSIAEQAVQVDSEVESVAVKVDIRKAGQNLSEYGLFNKAVELLQIKQWQTAETLLLELLNGPQDLAARKQLLGIYARPGNADKYADMARRSSLQYPNQSLFKTEYARSLFQQQSYHEAISQLQSVDQLDSKQQALMAASYQRIGQHEKAIEHYHHSLRLNKLEARNWVGLGISLEHEAHLEKALQSYQMAARLGNINERLKQFVEQRSRLLKKVMN